MERCQRYRNSVLPSVVTTDSPDTDSVDGLTVENGKGLGIDQLQGTFVQIHKQILSLLVRTERPAKMER